MSYVFLISNRLKSTADSVFLSLKGRKSAANIFREKYGVQTRFMRVKVLSRQSGGVILLNLKCVLVTTDAVAY